MVWEINFLPEYVARCNVQFHYLAESRATKLFIVSRITGKISAKLDNSKISMTMRFLLNYNASFNRKKDLLAKID
jgi:hypothetical protein